MSTLPSEYKPPSFYNVDQGFDFLVETGIRPIVELSFMPSSLVTCGTGGTDPETNRTVPPCAYSFGDHGGYKGLRMPPDDFNDWYTLISGLSHHLVEVSNPHLLFTILT